VSEEEEDTHLHKNHQLPHELGNGKTLLVIDEIKRGDGQLMYNKQKF
jgi:hypothetical protein